nr:retinoblastoma-binding protein 5 homolog isoform X1 [Drosophila simulans]
MTGQCGPSSSGLKSIEFARRGDAFLINTSDRVIRVYDSKEIITLGKDGEPEPIQKLQDLVNKYDVQRTLYNQLIDQCQFHLEPPGKSAASPVIWEKSIGNLVKILHGTKGELQKTHPIISSKASKDKQQM